MQEQQSQNAQAWRRYANQTHTSIIITRETSQRSYKNHRSKSQNRPSIMPEQRIQYIGPLCRPRTGTSSSSLLSSTGNLSSSWSIFSSAFRCTESNGPRLRGEIGIALSPATKPTCFSAARKAVRSGVLGNWLFVGCRWELPGLDMKSRVSMASCSIAVAFWLGVLMASGRLCCGGVAGTGDLAGVAGTGEGAEGVEEALMLLVLRDPFRRREGSWLGGAMDRRG